MPLSLETHGQSRVSVCEIDRGCGESDTWKREDATFTALRIITHILKHNVFKIFSNLHCDTFKKIYLVYIEFRTIMARYS